MKAGLAGQIFDAFKAVKRHFHRVGLIAFLGYSASMMMLY
jgi:hypothetical protein